MIFTSALVAEGAENPDCETEKNVFYSKAKFSEFKLSINNVNYGYLYIGSCLFCPS